MVCAATSPEQESTASKLTQPQPRWCPYSPTDFNLGPSELLRCGGVVLCVPLQKCLTFACRAPTDRSVDEVVVRRKSMSSSEVLQGVGDGLHLSAAIRRERMGRKLTSERSWSWMNRWEIESRSKTGRWSIELFRCFALLPMIDFV
jgi:hypothetical protein